MSQLISPQERAHIGEHHLAEAVMGILLEARREGEHIGASEIGRRAAIFCEPGPGCFRNAIVSGVLCKLATQGRVQRCKQPNGRNGWELTDKQFKKTAG